LCHLFGTSLKVSNLLEAYTLSIVSALTLSQEYTMKRMLFNATQEEELRVAIVDGQ